MNELDYTKVGLLLRKKESLVNRLEILKQMSIEKREITGVNYKDVTPLLIFTLNAEETSKIHEIMLYSVERELKLITNELIKLGVKLK